MTRFFCNPLLCLLLGLVAAWPANAQFGGRNCCTISTQPGAQHTAYVGDTVAYDLSVNVGKCGGTGVEWTWEVVTPGLSITATPPGAFHEANVYIRPDAAVTSQWIARARAFDPATSVTTCTGFKLMNIDVPDGLGSLADLEAEMLSLPSQAAAGESLSVRGRISNNGGRAVLTSFSNRLYVDGSPLQALSCSGGVPVGGSCPDRTWNLNLDAGLHTLELCADTHDEIPEENENNNCQSREVTIYERADLVVRSMWVAPASPRSGEPFTVFVELANEGLGEAPSFMINLGFANGSDENRRIPGLPAGQSRTESFSSIASDPGTYVPRVILDSLLEVEETNENNNVSVVHMTVTPAPGLPDLTFYVSDLSMDPTDPVVGDIVEFSVTLRNRGDAVTPFHIPAAIEVEDGTFSDAAYCWDLEPEDTCTYTFDVPMTGAGTRQFIARVDVENGIEEILEDNNHRSLSYNVEDPSGPTLFCQGTWTLRQVDPVVSPQPTFTSAGSVKANTNGNPCFVYFGQNVPTGCWLTEASGGLKATWHHDGTCPTAVTVIDEDPVPGEPSQFHFTVDIDP